MRDEVGYVVWRKRSGAMSRRLTSTPMSLPVAALTIIPSRTYFVFD